MKRFMRDETCCSAAFSAGIQCRDEAAASAAQDSTMLAANMVLMFIVTLGVLIFDTFARQWFCASGTVNYSARDRIPLDLPPF
jgi:hypothetical protein